MRPLLEQVADSLTQVFATTQNSLGAAIGDVLNGYQQVGNAFRGMMKTIQEELYNMAAKIIANQILSWILQMVVGRLMPTSMKTTVNGMFENAGMKAPFQMGGATPAPVQAKASGGLITGGVPGRDSVNLLAEPGEVVVRKSAVDSVGRDFLLDLNAQGNRRASQVRSATNPMLVKKEPDTVNVYVMAPDQKPGMTKKDVLVTWADDFARNGQTKQLIKQVMVGR
jgi:hypothetical protein